MQHALICEVGVAEVQPRAAGVRLQGVEDLTPLRLREAMVGQVELCQLVAAESCDDVGRRPAEGLLEEPESCMYVRKTEHEEDHGRNGEEEEEENSGWGPLRQGSGCSATTRRESSFSDSADVTFAA